MNLNASKILISLLSLKGIGPAFVGKNLEAIQSSINQDAGLSELLDKCGKSGYSADEINEASDAADNIIDLCNADNISIVNLLDDNYPKKVLNVGFKWPLLYYKGNVDFKKRGLGIIGSRDATPVGIEIAKRIGAFAISEGFSIINGLAKGIDAAGTTDKVALQSCIGVAPGGLAFQQFKTLSKEYQQEAERVLEQGGAIVSGFSPYDKQNQFSVVEYCKLQAGLADALILIQSKVDGGSRFTLETFSRLNRKLGVVNAANLDQNRGSYSANDLILRSGQNGLAEMCGLKENKILCEIIEIKGKEDYDKLLEENSSASNQQGLFQ